MARIYKKTITLLFTIIFTCQSANLHYLPAANQTAKNNALRGVSTAKTDNSLRDELDKATKRILEQAEFPVDLLEVVGKLSETAASKLTAHLLLWQKPSTQDKKKTKICLGIAKILYEAEELGLALACVHKAMQLAQNITSETTRLNYEQHICNLMDKFAEELLRKGDRTLLITEIPLILHPVPIITEEFEKISIQLKITGFPIGLEKVFGKLSQREKSILNTLLVGWNEAYGVNRKAISEMNIAYLLYITGNMEEALSCIEHAKDIASEQGEAFQSVSLIIAIGELKETICNVFKLEKEQKITLSREERIERAPLLSQYKPLSVDAIRKEEVLEQVLGTDTYKLKDSKEELPFSYMEKLIDLKDSKDIKGRLGKYFKEEVKPDEKYYVLYFNAQPIAIVKKDSNNDVRIEPGKTSIVKLAEELGGITLEAIAENAEEIRKERKGAIDLVLDDYVYFLKRAKIPAWKRYCLTFKEQRQHQELFEKEDEKYRNDISKIESELKKNPDSLVYKNRLENKLKHLKEGYKEFLKSGGFELSGGKGLSLSLTESVAPTPWGVNATSTAYFALVKANEEARKAIEELATLDATDDQIRNVIGDRIRHAIMNAKIPEEVEEEIIRMYRHLNILAHLSGKKTPVAVAERSSGIRGEDSKIQSWFPVTSGSQAGQADTYLNVRGIKNVLDKWKACCASLFTDRAISYRDGDIFQIFAATMGFGETEPQRVYHNLMEKLREYSSKNSQLGKIADTLTKYQNPGSVNLIKAMIEILEYEPKNAEISHCLELLMETAKEFVHPDLVGMSVVIMRMVESCLAGVAFTVNPATKFAGVSQALYKAWYENDDTFVNRNEKGEIISTKANVVSFEISHGYGENVVGGKVRGDKFVMVTLDGDNWFTVQSEKGDKFIQMVDVEYAFEFLRQKEGLDETKIRNIASMVKDAISYDEVQKQIKGILAKDLQGISYLIPESGETDNDKKVRLQMEAEKIADMFKSGVDNNTNPAEIKGRVVEYIKSKFYVQDASRASGIDEDNLKKIVDGTYDLVKMTKEKSSKGKNNLKKYFNRKKQGNDYIDSFIKMVKGVWHNERPDVPDTDKKTILDKIGVDERNFKNLSYLIRSLIDNSFTCNILTTDSHKDAFSISDSEAAKVAIMVSKIANFYKDARDVEFAIEIDPKAEGGSKISIYALDKEGNVLGMRNDEIIELSGEEKEQIISSNENMVKLSLYNVQARPYTAEYTKVDFVLKRTETDEDFIEKHGIKPIATGTKGENATHAYILAFDTTKSVAWHADEIKRLKRGKFTDGERKLIRDLGFNPDDYTEKSEKKLPVALYLSEADPHHDPIMNLVDAVVTIHGGDTCHAAIFCRERCIPAITGTRPIVLDNRALKTGDGLTIDANSGRLFKIDPNNKIPIKFTKLRLKPYAIPGVKRVVIKPGLRKVKWVDEDDFEVPGIGLVIAAEEAVQRNAPHILADSDGNALERAEFLGEKLGIHPTDAYGYDLIKQIEAGKMQPPKRISAKEIISKSKKSKKDKENRLFADFVEKVNDEIYRYLKKDALQKFKNIVGKQYAKDCGIKLLAVLDAIREEENGNNKPKLSSEQGRLWQFIQQVPGEQGANLIAHYYGEMERNFNYDYNIIEKMKANEYVIKKTEEKIKEGGCASAQEYLSKNFYNFYNLMGFCCGSMQKASARSYDFAMDKIRGLIGDIFAEPGKNPFVGLRGIKLEHYDQKVLSFLIEAVIDAHKNTRNQSFFYVFIRFANELEIMDRALQMAAGKKGMLPREVGIMIEVPSCAMQISEISERLNQIKEKYKKYGVESVFFSFGTNDYTYIASKACREDYKTKLKIEDPAAIQAIDEIIKSGYYYDKSNKNLPLAFEGAYTILQLIEAVVREADNHEIITKLCGELVTNLVKIRRYDLAGKVMALLNSFGVSTMSVRLLASMVRYDAMSAMKEIDVPSKDRNILIDLKSNGDEIRQDEGVIKGEIIFIDDKDDLVPNSLKGLKGDELTKKKEFMKLQSPESAQSTMSVYNKIVVLTKNFVLMQKQEFLETMKEKDFNILLEKGLVREVSENVYVWANLYSITSDKFLNKLENMNFDENSRSGILKAWNKAWDNTTEGLERQGIDWDDLQYAKAIIIDAGVSLEDWDVFDAGKSIIPTRVKVISKNIGKEKTKLNGKFVTIDYKAGKIYEGDLKVKREKVEPRSLPIPEIEPAVNEELAVRENANDAYGAFKFHPLLIHAYGSDEKNFEKNFAEIFNKHIGDLYDEADKISKISDESEKKDLLGRFMQKIKGLPEDSIKTSLENICNNIAKNKSIEIPKQDAVREKYIKQLKNDISSLLKQEDKTADEFIRQVFKQHILDTLKNNTEEFVIHTTTSLNCAELSNMLVGSFLVEDVNPNPDYGLKGAAKAISDFYPINRLELQAFKEARDKLGVQQKKRLGLQITDLQGTQAGAVVIAWKHILKEMNLIPGQDGLQVGINIATPSDTLSLDKYIEHFKELGTGLSFVTYDIMMLGAAWSGVDIYWDQWRRLASEKDIVRVGYDAIKIIKKKINDANGNSSGNNIKVFKFSDDSEFLELLKEYRKQTFDKVKDQKEEILPRRVDEKVAVALQQAA
ncbi:MAG: PEP/pyruvate-binding domain-containing protein [Candidatus Omnitrophota bacterium]